jgi:hypothetical protein
LNVKIVETGKTRAAVCESSDAIIKDGQTALDFAVNIGHEHNCQSIIVNKAAIDEEFFKLSTGVAGEVVQKFVNYGCRLAIFGDFSIYTSKSLHDYMYESNKGSHLYFAKNEREALEMLGG